MTSTQQLDAVHFRATPQCDYNAYGSLRGGLAEIIWPWQWDFPAICAVGNLLYTGNVVKTEHRLYMMMILICSDLPQNEVLKLQAVSRAVTTIHPSRHSLFLHDRLCKFFLSQTRLMHNTWSLKCTVQERHQAEAVLSCCGAAAGNMTICTLKISDFSRLAAKLPEILFDESQ